MLFRKNIWLPLVILMTQSGCGPEIEAIPSDNELIENFHANRRVFESYVEVFSEIDNLQFLQTAIPGSGIRLGSNLVDLPLPVDSTVNDMEIFMRVDLIRTRSYEGDNVNNTNELNFYSYRDGKVKGVAYFYFKNDGVIVSDLDRYDPPFKQRFPTGANKLYLKIGDGWYLFSG